MVLGVQSVDAVAPVLPLVPVLAESFVLFALSPPVAAAPPAVTAVDGVPFVETVVHGAFALFVFGTVLVVPLELEGVVPVVAPDPLLLEC